jgi:hypothetical protein
MHSHANSIGSNVPMKSIVKHLLRCNELSELTRQILKIKSENTIKGGGKSFSEPGSPKGKESEEVKLVEEKFRKVHS